MNLNIFKIDNEKLNDLLDKFKNIDLISQGNKKWKKWNCSFYLSKNPEIKKIIWAKEYKHFLKEEINNKIYFAVYLCKSKKHIFAITYGKSHFYVRPFCDENFAIEMAKRIINQNDIKQLATKRFAGKKKKEIKAYINTSIHNNESGESIEHITASIIEEKQKIFGNKVKIGSSLQLSIKNINIDDIPELLNKIIILLSEKPKFELPRTIKIKNNELIKKYNNELIKNFLSKNDNLSINIDSYNIIGTDIIFSGQEKYQIQFNSKKSDFIDSLELDDILNFITKYNISNNKIFSIKILVENEGRKAYQKSLKYFIDYKVKNENIIFQNSKWIKFNEEYIKQINSSVDSIEIEKTEDKLKEIYKTEPLFNESKEVEKEGYETADKDFTKLEIGTGYKVEAWDLRKNDIVYAVKFGNAQKLVYVCNQAIAVIDIIANNAQLKKLDNPPKKYCLWFAFNNKKEITKISDIKSIIFKQQIDLFAKKCRDLGIQPMIKISKKGNK